MQHLVKALTETRGKLTQRGMLSSGGTTRVIDMLEAASLIRRARCVKNRRVLNIHLTDKGHLAVFATPKVVADVNAAFLTDFTGSEVEKIRGLLQRMLLAIKT